MKKIAVRYLEIMEKKNKNHEISLIKISNARRAYIFWLHRTTFYKESKEKVYKINYLKNEIFKIFYENNKIYRSLRIAAKLNQNGHSISDRTLRNYMNRWKLECIT
ncbi:hypothetical protein [Candidatus Mycoplasma mahonii]|uniref:hypothetical protein n=1 Tax=Candidatus Mycoplasma mahonii TaxID=3004105 RepID=UPI0026ED0295|nr:hypothetical protein [Candidatus Mycoplasma mahonii]WKX02621.1 hypothetical protein O3I44_00885 [Candidatus Mycoplasma mahonii]